MGRWVLDRELGRGATATVWSAQHTSLGAPVAIKIFHRRDLPFHTVLGEAQAAAGIPSKHAIWVHDVDTLDGWHCIVMELCASGGTAATNLRDLEIPDPREAVRLISEAALGVEAAHAGGIFHKDIKPANILRNPADGRAQVADFGLANPALWAAVPPPSDREAQSTVCLTDGDRVDSDPGAIRPDDIPRVHPPRHAGVHGPRASQGAPPRPRSPRAHAAPAPGRDRLSTASAPRSTTSSPGTRPTLTATPWAETRAPSWPRPRAARPPRSGRLRRACPRASARSSRRRCIPIHDAATASAAALSDDLQDWLDGRPTSVDRSMWVRLGVHLHRERAAVSLLAVLAAVTLASSLLVWSNSHRIAQQDSELASQAARLQDQQQALVDLSEDHSATELTLQSTTADLAETRATLQSRSRELDRREAELLAQQRALATTRADLEMSQATVLDRDAQLGSAATQITALEAEQLSLENGLTALRADLAIVEARLARTEESLALTEQAERAQQARAERLDGQVATLEDQLAAQLATATQLRTDLRAAEGRATELRGQVADISSALARAESARDAALARAEAAEAQLAQPAE